jgi:hypothetical protein
LILLKNNGQEENQVASFCNLIFDLKLLVFKTLFNKNILILKYSYSKLQPAPF